MDLTSLFGELRSALNASRVFERLDLLEHAEALDAKAFQERWLPYLQGFSPVAVSATSVGALERWAPRLWPDACVWELDLDGRVTPDEYTALCASGCLGQVRALDVRRSGLEQEHLFEILLHPGLTGLERLDVGWNDHLELMDACAGVPDVTLAFSPTLQELGLAYAELDLESRAASAFFARFPGLTSLCLRSCRVRGTSEAHTWTEFVRFIAALPRLEQLDLRGAVLPEPLPEEVELLVEALPELGHLRMCDHPCGSQPWAAARARWWRAQGMREEVFVEHERCGDVRTGAGASGLWETLTTRWERRTQPWRLSMVEQLRNLDPKRYEETWRERAAELDWTARVVEFWGEAKRYRQLLPDAPLHWHNQRRYPAGADAAYHDPDAIPLGWFDSLGVPPQVLSPHLLALSLARADGLRLRSLKLHAEHIPVMSQVMHAVAPKLAGLERIELQGREGLTAQEGAAFLVRLLECCPRLREVSLYGYPLDDAGGRILGASTALRQVRSLEIESGSYRLGLEGLVTSEHFEGVEVLRLNRTPLWPHTLEVLTSSPHTVALRTLCFGGCEYRDIGRVLERGLPALERLELTYNWVGPHGLRAMLETERLEDLTHLSLYQTEVNDASVEALFRSGRVRGLRHLNLCYNALGDGPLEVLAHQEALPALERLDLSCNEIGEEGARALARAMCLKGLRCLSLGSNRISSEGWAALLGSPHLAGLEVLLGDLYGEALRHAPMLRSLRAVYSNLEENLFEWIPGVDELLERPGVVRVMPEGEDPLEEGVWM